jgi:hypothetical protein
VSRDVIGHQAWAEHQAWARMSGDRLEIERLEQQLEQARRDLARAKRLLRQLWSRR